MLIIQYTLRKREEEGRKGRLYMQAHDAASKALYLQYKAKGDTLRQTHHCQQQLLIHK